MGRKAPLLLLVGEDQRAARELTTWLYAQGFNAVVATSCLEAAAVIEAVPVSAVIGDLALRDGSLFDLARAARARGATVVVGCSDVDVRPPPELDACFVRPLNRAVLGSFLAARFTQHSSGEHRRISTTSAVLPEVATPLFARRRR